MSDYGAFLQTKRRIWNGLGVNPTAIGARISTGPGI